MKPKKDKYDDSQWNMLQNLADNKHNPKNAKKWLIINIPSEYEDDVLLYTYSQAVKKYWGKIQNAPARVAKIAKIYGC